MPARNDRAEDGFSAFSVGKNIMEKSDCKTCHALDKKIIGPAFTDVSNKYKNDPGASQYLSKKIREGGSGIWGETTMAAHPDMPERDVAEIVHYILSLSQKPVRSMPLKGACTTALPKGQSDEGVFLLRASYTDKGGNGIPGIRSEQVIVLRNAAAIPAAACDKLQDIRKYSSLETQINWMIVRKNRAYVAYDNIDLNGIEALTIMGIAPSDWNMAGGSVELRLGSPQGEVIGTLPIQPRLMGPPARYTAPLKMQSGKHDIYFVCINDKADSGQDLFMLSQVRFQAGPAKPRF
jgi:cytochrome c